jgi:flagellar FliJ protein
MKRSTRLKPIVDLIETRERDAVQKLGQGRQKVEAAQRGLDSLKTFLDNYTDRFNRTGNQGLGVRQLTEYRSFLGKINVAIADQEKAVQKAQSECARLQADWEEARRKTRGMKKVLEKTLTEESRLAEKALQAEQDEWASRRSGKTSP